MDLGGTHESDKTKKRRSEADPRRHRTFCTCVAILADLGSIESRNRTRPLF